MIRLKSLAFLILLLLLSGCGPMHPSDEALLRKFKRRESELEQLLSMIRTDKKIERLGNDWSIPADLTSIGISPERIQQYRQLFPKLWIDGGFSAKHDPEQFKLFVNIRGFAVSGSSKGYAYLEKQPQLVVTNLNTYRSPDREYTAYRHIQGNWYLFLRHSD